MGEGFQHFWKSNYLWRYSPQHPLLMENWWRINLRKMLLGEQGINILSCPQNQSCALFNTGLLTISIPFVLVNGISNPLCINLAEFAAPPEKHSKISQMVLSIIKYIFSPVLFLFKNANWRHMKTIHCTGSWHNGYLFCTYAYICMHTYTHIYTYMYLCNISTTDVLVLNLMIFWVSREDYRWFSAPF